VLEAALVLLRSGRVSMGTLLVELALRAERERVEQAAMKAASPRKARARARA
jgi:hypothetical protein